MKCRLAVVVGFTLLLASIGSVVAAQYDITELKGISDPAAINNHGQVVGLDQTDHSIAIWQNGNITTLGKLPGYSDAFIFGFNDDGVVVGDAFDPITFTSRGYIGINGLLQPLSDNPSFSPRGINNSGVVVGTADGHAAILTNNELTILESPIGSQTREVAYGINNKGEIAGVYGESGLSGDFVWRNDQYTYVGSFDDSSIGTMPCGINDNGLVVGWTWRTDNRQHSYMWKDGKSTELSMLDGYQNCCVCDVNNNEQIIGYLWTVSEDQKTSRSLSVMWHDGQIVDLNNLIDPSSGWVVSRCISNNDAGQIIGYGEYNGSTRYFIMTPVPEPSSIFALVCGLGTMGGIVRRRAKHH